MALVMIQFNHHWDFFYLPQHHRRTLRIQCSQRNMMCRRYNKISIYLQNPRVNVDLLYASFDFYFENWPEEGRCYGQVSYPIHLHHWFDLPVSSSVLGIYILSYNASLRSRNNNNANTNQQQQEDMTSSTSSTSPLSLTSTLPTSSSSLPRTEEGVNRRSSSHEEESPSFQDSQDSQDSECEGMLTIQNARIDEIIIPIPSLSSFIMKEICFRNMKTQTGYCPVCMTEDLTLHNVHSHRDEEEEDKISSSSTLHAFCMSCLLQITTVVDLQTNDAIIPCPLCRQNILKTCTRY